MVLIGYEMLEEYNKKRNFKVTPEPSGGDIIEKGTSENNEFDHDKKSRFVIQKHDATRLHYDFRLESKKKNILISWAVPKGPSIDPKVKRLAILTEDHPIDYLLFEGIIPEGNYGAGSVIVWDTGSYNLEVTEDMEKDVSDQFKKGKINFILFGKKLKGRFSIIKTSRENQWLLFKVNDKFSNPSNIEEKNKDQVDLVKSSPESVLTGLTNNDLKNADIDHKFNKEIKEGHRIDIQIKKDSKAVPINNIKSNTLNGLNASAQSAPQPQQHRNLPTSISSSIFHTDEFPYEIQPMLATLLDKPFNSQDWVFEIKWDGVRAISFIHRSKEILKIQSRNGNTITQRYPELIESLRSVINENNFKESIVFDGEIVILDKNGFPDFQKHQKRMNINTKIDIESLSKEIPATYYIFDILYIDGIDIKMLQLVERRKILENIIIKNKRNNRIKVSEFIEGDGKDIFESIKRMNIEGMIAKYKQGKYYPNTRSKEWLKLKNTKTQDCIIIGYTKGEGNRVKYFGSLLLAANVDNKKLSDGKKFRFIGHCGSGFDFEQIPSIYNNLEKIKTKTCPIEFVPYINRETTWVKPIFVVEVKFNNWTKDKIMRAPIFLRFREDKNPQECIIEENVKIKTENNNDNISIVSKEEEKKGLKIKNRLPNNGIKSENNPNFRGDEIICGDSDDVVVEEVLFKHHFEYKSEQQQMVSNPQYSLNTNYNFSNLEKIYWNETKLHPLITKKDLIEYYDKISSFILPHLRDRPLSLNRYPDGIGGKSFYHKNWQNEKPEYVQTIKIYSESKGENINYLLCNNKETLLWLSNIGCIEMHPWYSRAKNYDLNDKISNLKVDEYGLNYPDFIVFDLDPYIYSGNEDKHQEPEYNLKAFKATVEIAYYLKDIFDKVNVNSFIKTSGKTGLHIFIPIINTYTYEQTKSFVQIIGKFLNKRLPDKITTEWNTSRRKDMVFFDYNQNARGKTIASVFSPRPIELATVSMPIEWKDLSNIIPTDFTITNTVEILKIKKDPWKNIFDQKQDLVKILNNVSGLSI
jgi:bifunctional non-homologous end joining protein LigD